MLMDVFCRALKDAYAQVNTLALDDTVHRLIKTLIGLATKIGRQSGLLTEIPTYLTQEEIAQMSAARRERISTALNCLRRQRPGAVLLARTSRARCKRARKLFRLKDNRARISRRPPAKCYKSNTRACFLCSQEFALRNFARRYKGN
jgi:hypothetical protein